MATVSGGLEVSSSPFSSLFHTTRLQPVFTFLPSHSNVPCPVHFIQLFALDGFDVHILSRSQVHRGSRRPSLADLESLTADSDQSTTGPLLHLSPSLRIPYHRNSDPEPHTRPVSLSWSVLFSSSTR